MIRSAVTFLVAGGILVAALVRQHQRTAQWRRREIEDDDEGEDDA